MDWCDFVGNVANGTRDQDRSGSDDDPCENASIFRVITGPPKLRKHAFLQPTSERNCKSGFPLRITP